MTSGYVQFAVRSNQECEMICADTLERVAVVNVEENEPIK